MKTIQDAIKYLFDKVEKMDYKKLNYDIRNWMNIQEFRNCYYDNSPYVETIEEQSSKINDTNSQITTAIQPDYSETYINKFNYFN